MLTKMIMTRPAIILFGDSITQQGFSSAANSPGWVGLLSNAYTRRADVLNRGFSGYNTRHAVDLLPTVFNKDMLNHHPNSSTLFVTVFFGANDASLPGEREHNQHVPIEEYELNLRTIVADIWSKVEEQKTPIILITPPPLDEKAWDKYCREEFDNLSPRSNEQSKLYGERVKLVAYEMGCSIVDSFSLLGGNDGVSAYGECLEDGLHLSAKGNELLYDGLMDVITRDFPHLAPKVNEDDSTGIALEGAQWKDLC
mmetsp:Transcript_10741/g.15326  ORF Transcript_10741/g.15326 Transcript_10741/m.15326 type:complete len:255 (-) Transcript_10741:49-813(-)